MNVLFIVPSNANAGPVNVVRSIVKGFSDNSSVSCFVLCLSRMDEEGGFECETYFSDSSSVFSSLLRVKEMVVEKSIDLLHTHGLRPDILGCFVSLLRANVRLISTVHNVPQKDYLLEYGKLKGFFAALIHIAILRVSSFPIACSQAVTNSLKRVNLHSVVVRNGVEVKSRVWSDKKEGVLFLGRLIDRKNPLEFIDGVKLATANDPNFKGVPVHIAGSGGLDKVVEYSARGESNISMFGHVDNPRELLEASSTLVSTSLAEGFPLSVLEAIEAGCSVVLSDIEPHVEIRDFLGSSNIFIYELGNIADLVIKVRSALSMPLEYSDKRLWLISIDRMCEEYYQIYKEVLNE